MVSEALGIVCVIVLGQYPCSPQFELETVVLFHLVSASTEVTTRLATDHVLTIDFRHDLWSHVGCA